MAKQGSQDLKRQLGDEALSKKTGKTWAQWFAVLDKTNADKMPHAEIAEYLNRKLHVPGWWSQMITVGYEQARGLRQKHERPDGFEISVSKVMPVPVKELFRSWAEPSQRNRWLNKTNLKIRTATPNKSLRLDWCDKKTILSVNFYPKAVDKSQVVVQHGKFADSAQAEKMKKYWKTALGRLYSYLG